MSEMIRLGILAPKRKGSSYYVPCRELCETLGMDERALTINGRAKVMEALTHDTALYDAVKDLVTKANGGEVTIHPNAAEAPVTNETEDEDDEQDGVTEGDITVSFDDSDVE